MDLVKKAKELFSKRKENDALGISSSPIELKVLALLKVLGRGVCHDNCADCISMNKETHRRFFHKFCHLFAKKFYFVYVEGRSQFQHVRAETEFPKFWIFIKEYSRNPVEFAKF